MRSREKLWRRGGRYSLPVRRPSSVGDLTMDTQLYLRVRGRVLGPYDEEKLQSLVRRGQLSRMHEVSTDGTHWVRASTYAELFVGAPVKLVAPEMAVAAPPPAQ